MLKLSLDAIQVIDAIERFGSFSAAAQHLHKVPSTISYTVTKLEQQLGMQLFERHGPRVSLTHVGAELLKEGRWLVVAAGDTSNAACDASLLAMSQNFALCTIPSFHRPPSSTMSPHSKHSNAERACASRLK